MKKITAFKKNITKLLVVLTVFCIALSCCFSLSLGTALAHEQDGDYDYSFKDYANTELSISNNQFETAGTSSYPYSASSWTGKYFGNYSGTGLVSGIIKLTGEDYLDEDNYEDAKLHKYEEYSNKQIPKSPFGINTDTPNGDLYYPGTNKNVLMINTNGSTVSYGYSSGNLSLEANAFYKVSAFVKTGDFNQSQGAVIKLTGFKDETDVGFWNINTLTALKDSKGDYELNKNNLFGWKEYVIYVATGYNTESVTLNLQVGDYSEEYVTPSNGYAFFDNVNAYKISATSFYNETANFSNQLQSNYTVKDMNIYDYLNDGNKVVGDFSNGFEGWTDITEDENGNHFGGGMKYIYDATKNLSSDNGFGLNADPVAPKGKIADAGVNTNNILIMRSPTGAQIGLRSTDILVQRNKYYRIGVWANAQHLHAGSDASVVITGESTIAVNDYKLEPVSDSTIGENKGNAMRYGWKEVSFYVAGSSLKDVKLNVELWLGYSATSEGLVMFDEITVKELSYTEYKDNKTNGTEVIVDASVADTGVTNGLFTIAGDNDEYKYPLAPASWTMYDASSVGTTGYSTTKVDTDNIAMGIIATDDEHFNANRSNYLGASNPVNAGDNSITNALLIASANPTAICYASSDISIAASSYYKLEITLQVRDIEGYGANIVLKDGTNVIGSIERITTTNYNFKTYTFYIKGGSAASTSTVEIWLGLGDKNVNRSKLSSGYVYVSKVALTTVSDEAEFTTQVNSFKADYAVGQISDKSYYSFADADMDMFDYYSNDHIKEAYKWSIEKANQNSMVTAGYFDANNMPAGQTEIPSYFTKSFADLETTNSNVLYLRNVSQTYSTLRLAKTVTFTATKYYLVSFDIMVDIPQEYFENKNTVGAKVAIGGISREIEIKNTFDTAGIENSDGTVTYNKIFKNYKFYIAVGDADINSSITVSLGGSLPNQYISGRVFVANASIQEITNVAYEEEIEGVEEDDEFIRFASFLSTDTENNDTEEDDDLETDTDSTESTELPVTSAWWFIPSILFAVAVFAALIGVIIRKLLHKRSTRKIKAGANSYDRRQTLLFDSEGTEGVKATEETNDSLANFDDDKEIGSSEIKLVASAEETTAQSANEEEFHDEFDD
ncbi:MAG: hypothetical protein IJD07_00115 [Clostridia bacterium]|nr:hypothetical protein [Clostridia bacterium]